MDVGKLEQAIREAPDTPDAYLVYGDWLESQGDPRGELIAVQAKLATTPDDGLFTHDTLLQRAQELIVTNEPRWLGDVLYTERRANRLVCDWHFGFLRSVTMFVTSPELFAALAACPSAKFLRRLVIDPWVEAEASDVPHARTFGPLCEVVREVEALPPPISAELRREAEDAMSAVRAEAAADNAWDAEFRASPYSPWAVADERLAKPEYLAYLCEQLAVEGEPSHWAKFAFQQLGPKAAAAATALRTFECWLELWYVAPDRARSLGVHLRMPMRREICERLERVEPRALAAHLVDLFTSADDDVVQFALEGHGFSDRSCLERLTRRRPRLVAVARIRALAEHPKSEIRDHAISRLVEMRFPEDSDRVIDAMVAGRAWPKPHFAMWLGSHPKSDQLLPMMKSDSERAHVVRRRRCAGLAKEIEEYDPSYGSHRPAIERADELYLEGKVDDSLLVEHGALGCYARQLIDDPACAPAAFRVAWIERGFGAKITPERISWLRSLGCTERGLAMLAKAPAEIMPGYGYGARSSEPDPIKAAAALAAGLPSLAYWYLPKDSAEALAAREAAKLQLPTLC